MSDIRFFDSELFPITDVLASGNGEDMITSSGTKFYSPAKVPKNFSALPIFVIFFLLKSSIVVCSVKAQPYSGIGLAIRSKRLWSVFNVLKRERGGKSW